jgi:hypothetical protein
MGEKNKSIASDENVCLCATGHGKIYHCPELGRFVVDFKGIYLVLRSNEFFRLAFFFKSIVGCGRLKFRQAQDTKIQLRDGISGNLLCLGFSEISSLTELLDSAVNLLFPVRSGLQLLTRYCWDGSDSS